MNPAAATKIRNEEILRKYIAPPHPTAFAGIGNLAARWHVPATQMRKILADNDAYTLHRSYRRPKVRNPYYVYTKRDMAQADLADMQQVARYNDGVAHLLTVINVFTKKVYVRTLKTKGAAEVAAGMRSILDSMGADPVRLVLSDNGTEFKNATMARLLRDRGIEQRFTFSEIKAGVVERSIRSLKDLIYRSMTERQSNSYTEQLPSLVESYNSRPHRSIDKLSPNEAELPQNMTRVVSALRAHYAKAIRPPAAPKFKVGDLVRVKCNYGNRFARGFQEQFSTEIYEIHRVNQRMAVTMYTLRSTDRLDIIQGAFYSNELSLVGKDRPFKIEKVLRRRTVRGVRQLFVKWVGYGPNHNSWIDEGAVTHNYGN
jgi:transposase InsO family protein